jgi:hypothetical protein
MASLAAVTTICGPLAAGTHAASEAARTSATGGVEAFVSDLARAGLLLKAMR